MQSRASARLGAMPAVWHPRSKMDGFGSRSVPWLTLAGLGPQPDNISSIDLGSRDREIEFRLVERVNPIERLAFLDAVADLLEDLDAGALVDRRAGDARQAVETQTVDCLDHAVARRRYVGDQRPEIGAAAGRPLRFDDLVHLPKSGAAFEQLTRPRIAATAAQGRGVFETVGGAPQRFLAQGG